MFIKFKIIKTCRNVLERLFHIMLSCIHQSCVSKLLQSRHCIWKIKLQSKHFEMVILTYKEERERDGKFNEYIIKDNVQNNKRGMDNILVWMVF